MESEIELHDILTEMHAIATVPELYPVLVNLKAVLSLLELLSHENTDIAVAVVNLLQVSCISNINKIAYKFWHKTCTVLGTNRY